MNRIRTATLVAAIVASLGGLPYALAHTDAALDTQKPPHGGQLRAAGAYHFELVVAKDSAEAKDNPVLVYVTDHRGAAVPTAKTGGTATLLAGKTKTVIKLVPDGENRLKGVGRYASAPEMKAVVSVTFADKSVEQARFTPLSRTTGAPAGPGQ
ncbi:MAG: hypothetical protein MUC86_00480 [Burkholderiaceae bacterium]|jgi:hypothetical protein|nr:hypothetical protein [Burkholderiaceae bacterium]